MPLKHDHPLIYSVHGLRVRSEIALTELVCHDDGEPDIDIVWAKGAAFPSDTLAGNVLAAKDPDLGGWVLTEDEAGYTVRFLHEFDFRISRDLRAISVVSAPRAAPRIAAVILSGNILAIVLELRGECILHASCVDTGSWTVAIVGGSGMGKSTLAALLCADGGRLVSDDALRVEYIDGEAVCYPGTGQIRLRPSVVDLTNGFPGRVIEDTGDERIGINPERAGDGTLRLDAVILPIPSRSKEVLEVRRLGRREALIALVSYPRVVGWQPADQARRHFEVLGDISDAVPVFEATIPWGPPFPPETARQLIAELGLSSTRGV